MCSISTKVKNLLNGENSTKHIEYERNTFFLQKYPLEKKKILSVLSCILKITKIDTQVSVFCFGLLFLSYFFPDKEI